MRPRRAVLIAVGLALIGGTVVALRTTQADDVPPEPGPHAVLERFGGDGVVLPEHGERPAQPTGLAVTPGHRRLQVRWAAADRAAGYQVRWGAGGQLDHTRLVALSSIELDGLDNGVAYQVEVRAVDAFGQRSEAVTASGTPATPPGDLADVPNLVFADRFEHPNGLDPTRWRLIGECARANRGTGADRAHLVLGGSCGSNPLVLRSRTPFRPADPATADGELGRLVVETDAPGGTGELLLDLVPGPADLVGPTFESLYVKTLPAAAEVAGRAQDDASLPPGTIRVRVGGGHGGKVGVWTLVSPGMPRLAPLTEPVAALPELGIGITHRWEVVLRRDGVRVLVDGQLVGTGDVVPQWTEATALLGFSAGQLLPTVDLVAMAGGASQPPAQLTPPKVLTVPDTSPTPATEQRLTGVSGARLRLDVTGSVPDQWPATAPELSIQVGGAVVPLRPAIANTPWPRAGVHHPMVADLPAEALVVRDDYTLVAGLRVPAALAEAKPPRSVDIAHADVELIADPAATPRLTRADGSTVELPAPLATAAPASPPAQLPRPVVGLLDASGQPFEPGRTLPRGRLVLEVTLDGEAGQLAGQHLAGVAGFGVRLDDVPLATVPTAVDGPGVGGRWRVAFTSEPLAAGPHTIEVRAIGTDNGYQSGYGSFLLAQ